jgi:hypothetical protein
VLCHAFRRGELPEFFATARTGPRQQPKKSRAHEQIVARRKRNYSIYEISQALKEQGTPLGATAVREVLAAEGFASLPRRRDEERPIRVRPDAEAAANVHDFTLAPRAFTTRDGGLFLRRSLASPTWLRELNHRAQQRKGSPQCRPQGKPAGALGRSHRAIRDRHTNNAHPAGSTTPRRSR